MREERRKNRRRRGRAEEAKGGGGRKERIGKDKYEFLIPLYEQARSRKEAARVEDSLCRHVYVYVCMTS